MTDREIRNDAGALGQYAGYKLQTWRFLQLLINSSDGWVISLESFEDVGAQNQDRKIASQVKRSMRKNPVADRSVDLWKTFFNWIEACNKGMMIPEKTSFEIYVSSEFTGKIVELFHNASTATEIENAIDEASKLIHKKKIAQKLQPYIDTFFNTPKKLLNEIVKNFRLEMGSGYAVEDCRNAFKEKYLEDDIIDDILIHAIGWIEKRTTTQIDSGEVPVISVGEFRKEILSYRNKLRGSFILNSVAKSLDENDIRQGLLRKYVQQLDIIEEGEDAKIQAVRDYLTASANRTTWSERGMVHETSFDSFEDNLIRTWGHLKTKTGISHPNRSDIEKGKLLYAECSLHKASLQGHEVSTDFTSGSFHALSDVEKVGWHPQYKEVLKQRGNSE